MSWICVDFVIYVVYYDAYSRFDWVF